MKIAVFCAAALALQAAPALAAKPMFQPWIDGTATVEPQTQVQQIDADTFVIRQSVKTNFEAPFLYLLFGKDRVLLLDSGAGGLKIRPAVDAVIDRWLAAHRRPSIPLVVAHTHGHGDHRMGDDEFRARPDTTVIGLKPEDVAAYFQIAHWPTDIATFDLGRRVLDIIPTPGHQPAHIMIFDRKTRILFSGDTLYPGRLYVPTNMFGDYRDSLDRVVAFARRKPPKVVLGAHIEMNRTPGRDYVDAAPTHPDEHVLELPYADLLELQAAVHRMGDTPVREVHDDFIVYPIPPRK
jgi:glyoxylase-like metal-dependent hydrolase (beta-lactamase superfamily II)